MSLARRLQLLSDGFTTSLALKCLGVTQPTFHGEAVVIVSTTENATAPCRIVLPNAHDTAYRRELRSTVARAIDQGKDRIVVDCATWSEFDLFLLSALIDCAKACNEGRATFELANLEAHIRGRIEGLRLADRVGLQARDN